MEIGSSESQSECNLSIKLGMEFDSDEHAYDYYNEYASTIGFSIRKEYANKNKAQGIMSADKPQTFFTDQDPAISLVMPQTYHHLCVWHLKKNVFKHVSHIFRDNASFSKDFSKLLYDYEYEEDFLSAWQEMLDKYNLADNSWLKTTFAIREKWSMTYGRNTFSAGM
ncbi:hypothetical protein RDI58_017828 [Solanum bulbocastanum]|uniref:Protein FAR1-RELATED SEQUENCE n=1 Tax=Solanum bulbocastanum TaxID=147425 RepID=A0AAN8TGT6_SOLBU